jgi:UDP-N-acetylglucosamine--N-acetylmuramyl-(pentapeptide) pyrophosphoryl-undecaprenol N-acetylglucosamine transferase
MGISSTLSKIPLIIHEGNALVGKANLFLSRVASRMALSFPPVNAKKLSCQYEITGMPVRPNILQNKNIKKEDAIKMINTIYGTQFSQELPVVLIFGGSQGAMKINDLLPRALVMQKNKNFQVLHISGDDKIADMKALYSGGEFPSIVIGSTEKIHLFYAASDLVICRSGGSTIAELAIYGKYAILIPYPYAADNHQRDNAEYYSGTGAGVVITETDFTITKIASLIEDFLVNQAEYISKGALSAKIAKPDAAVEVINLIKNILTSH